MDPGLTVEILDDGRGEPPPGRLRAWSARRRAVAAAIGVLALAAVGLVAVRWMPEETWPTVVVVPPDDRTPGVGDPWQAGPDGRPTGPMTLSVSALLRQATAAKDPADGEVKVLGLAGPGISHSDTPAVTLPATGETVGASLSAVVDCSEVPGTVPADAYGLRVQVGSGSGRRARVVPAGPEGQSWGRAVQLGCATWTARRALTVTALTTSVHPTLPRLDVTLTVTNAGDRDATVERSPASPWDTTLDGPLPLRVPSHGSAAATLTIALDSCNGTGFALAPEGSTTGPLTSLVGLVAVVGSEPPAAAGGVSLGPFRDFGEGTQPTGVVLTDAAAATLLRGLSAACGDLGPTVTDVASGGVRIDPRSGALLVDLVIDVTPKRVRVLTLTADTSDPYALRPRWTTSPELIPDVSGQVRTTLAFTMPPHAADCTEPRSLPALWATLRIPAGSAERVVRTDVGVQPVDAVGRALLCLPEH